MIICGIDPGCTGALAILRDDGNLIEVEDMPSTQEVVGGTPRDRVNGQALAALLRRWTPSHAAVERVRPRGGDVKKGGDTPMTAGYLMLAAGTVDGVLAALGIPVTYVETVQWRKASDVKTGSGMTYPQRKEAARQRALQLYPAQAALFARKKDSDRAEAALVGRWLLARGDFA